MNHHRNIASHCNPNVLLQERHRGRFDNTRSAAIVALAIMPAVMACDNALAATLRAGHHVGALWD